MVEEEHHAHHHAHTGVKWLDIVMASSAILISVISLIVSIEHGRTMERLVESNARQVRASTLPILRFGTGNLDVRTNLPEIHFNLANGGTGPAIIQWFTLSYGGKFVGDAGSMLDACCRSDRTHGLSTVDSTASGQTLASGQEITLFTGRSANGEPGLYNRLDLARHKVQPAACFCSVLDECWVTDFAAAPRQVPVCPAPPGTRW